VRERETKGESERIPAVDVSNFLQFSGNFWLQARRGMAPLYRRHKRKPFL
jgi:hypothetical protein